MGVKRLIYTSIFVTVQWNAPILHVHTTALQVAIVTTRPHRAHAKYYLLAFTFLSCATRVLVPP